MKIGNSTIQFNITCKLTPTGERCTMDNVPYWRLYRRRRNKIKQNVDFRRSCLVFTFAEIIEYLSKYDLHDAFIAYPRFSNNTRPVFQYDYDTINELFLVLDKHTGEILCEIDANTAKTKYLCPTYKSDKYFRRKFFEKTADNGLEYTYMAARMMKN